MKTENKKDLIKTIVIVVLAIALIAESAVMVFVKKPTENNQIKAVINVDLSGAVSSIKPDVTDMINDIVDGIASEIPVDVRNIKSSVRNIIYSNAVVNTVMSIAYPLLFDTLTSLKMMDFAENAKLYPTGKQASALLKGKGYTAMDKSGERKDLGLVLAQADTNWNYMNSKVKSDSSGEKVSLWYTIDWGIKGKDSFYKAMNDMGEIFRGVLEVCLQNKEELININLADYILNINTINVNLDAAKIYNSSPKSGYESCIVYLFNMLGLDEGEYVSNAEFCAYTSIDSIWRAVFEPLLTAVEKAIDNPVQELCDMLVNFASALESENLVNAVKTLKMDGEFHQLASTFMGFKNGEIFSLGGALLDMIESLKINLSGNLNDTLDSLIRLISGSENADMPEMNTSALIGCASPVTLKNGNMHYKADTNKTVNFLISYAVDESTVTAILDLTSLKGTREEKDIARAVGKSKEGLRILARVLFSMITENV